MIPYIIKQARSSDDTRDNNVIVECGSTQNIDNLDKVIIDYIVDVMYEYGHNIQITSYSDFCQKYWDILGIQIRYWDGVFKVYYFENEWKEWNITTHQDNIFSTYYNKKI
jgi:hypothetical protein